MTVQRGAQALLVEVVADETDGATEDEEAVQGADLDVLVRLLGREGTGVAQQVDEADGDATVNVEDELGRLSEVGHEIWRTVLGVLTVSFFDVVTFSTASA